MSTNPPAFSSTEASRSQAMVTGLLEQRTPVAFAAGGPSMLPTIRDGEIVRVVPKGEARLQPGAIVLCHQHGRLVLHRLLRPGRLEKPCLLVGDAALSGGEFVAPEQIVGVAESLTRSGRTVRLAGIYARLRGLLRYGLRPLRRLMGALRRLGK